MNAAIDEKNFAIIEFSQGGGPRPFIKAAKALGIEWFVVADGDKAGSDYIKAATKCLEGQKLENHMFQLQTRDLEHELWMAGYDTVYKNAIAQDDLTVIETKFAPTSPDFIKAIIDKAISQRSKPEITLEVVAEVERKGIDTIPQSIRDIIARVVYLTEG